MDELIRALEKTVSNLQADQTDATKYIQDYIQRDFTSFFRSLAEVLHNEANQPVVRAAAGLQLKNQLTAREGTLKKLQQDRWRNLPINTRQYIKELVFNTLGTEIFRPTSAPQCIGYIATIEAPCPGLMKALCQNITSSESSPALKLASLETIGHVCQDIDQAGLPAGEANIILDAIVSHGMREGLDVRTAATGALLKFCESKVQKIAQTNQTMTFDQLGECLNIEPQFAEMVVAQMIREEKVQGHLDQIKRIAYFDSNDTMQIFDGEILKICSDVNNLYEKIRSVVPQTWWEASNTKTR